MTQVLESHPIIRGLGFVIASIVLFLLVIRVFAIEFTKQVRMQIYVATGAGLGIAFARNPIRRLLRDTGYSSEFVFRHSDYRNLGGRFLFLWMLFYYSVALIRGTPVDIIGVGNSLIIIFAFLIALASARYPDINHTIKNLGWILISIASATVVVFLLYSTVESIASGGLRWLSLPTALELLEPVIVAAVVIGAIQVIFGRTFGPTTRELEYDRFPATISISSDKEEKFLKAVQQLAEVWNNNPKGAPNFAPNSRHQADVTISVDGKTVANYTIEEDGHSESMDYSRIASEIGDEDERWIARDSPPRYPDGVETTRYLQIKVLTEVSDLGIKERVYLRIQAVKKLIGDSKT